MMSQSDHLYIVVNDKMNRSMKEFISTSTRVHQIIDLNPDSLAWHNGIPIKTLESILDSLKSGAINSVIDCTSTSTTAKIYAGRMRDASLCGTDLQHVHGQVGKLLAAKLLDECGESMGLVDSEKLPHVQGGTYEALTTSSSRNMLILPLMRGGEPMARGIHEIFSTARFIHLYDQEKEIDRMNSLLEKVLESSETTKPLNVFITDSVINTGKSIERTIKHVMKVAEDISPTLQLAVFVLSGVMQQEAADKLPLQFPKVRFVTLRVSKNKYKGVGGTDTGNRLFCTV
jgi:uracil phosphoribosyltransferase